jgi:hypothetical protein
VSDNPWQQAPTPKSRWAWFTDQPMWQRVLVVALVALTVIGLIVGRLITGDSGGSGSISKAQYQQWRAECKARATATLDTSLYRVGGNQWVDEVNRCLTAKAND